MATKNVHIVANHMRAKVCHSCSKIIELGTVCECKKNRNNYQKNYYQKNKSQLKDLHSVRWRKLRTHVLNRDGNLCIRCLYKFDVVTKKQLQAHHIKSRLDFPELTFDESNIVCVCKQCNLELGITNKLDFDYEINKAEYHL